MKLSTQLRDIVASQPASSYAIAKQAGIDKGTMSRFMHGGKLTMDKLDSLSIVLGLELVATKRVDPARIGRPSK